MLNIFVCEDENKQREKIERYIKNHIIIEELDAEVKLSTGDPDELLDYVRSNPVTGLYFLDVDLNHKKNGIMLGAEIRKIDTKGIIVFITTHAELSYLTFMYKVEAMDYITKDEFTDVQKRVIECIDAANERYLLENKDIQSFFQTKIGDKVVKIPYSEILFFESSPQLHKVILHTINRKLEFYGKLKDIEILSEDFFRCHNSYVVNKQNIVEINILDREIIMKNEAICYASSRYIKGLIK